MSAAESKAVFLSYASQDAAAVARLAEALRAAGVEVWFDRNELVGGDAWDAKIRGQIAACALFVPVISAATQARLEGYFRLEWKLAAQRTHLMAEAKPFLLPVVIDATRDAEAHVPEEFRAVQWTRLPGGETNNAFCARVRHLLVGPAVARATLPAAVVPTAPKYQAAPAPAEKSVAVLAFANLSPDPENEYFSDGISEDLIGMLGRVPGLTVRGRTSAFSFKGKNVPMPEIARQLGVTYVVRGSVRKAGNRVRVTAQLTRAADDELVWSSAPLERELKDVFAVQDEVVALIAENLSLQLGPAARPARAVNPEAHRLVLEGQYFWNRGAQAEMDRGEAAFAQAVALDPEFAEAHAGLAKVNVLRILYRVVDGSPSDRAELRHAREAAARAVALDPRNPDALAVQATACMIEGDLDAAEARFQEALTLNPNATLPRIWHGLLLANRGRLAAAIAENTKAIELDPLWFPPLQLQVLLLLEAGRFEAARRFAARVDAVRGEGYATNLLYRCGALSGLGHDAEAVAVARTARTRLEEQPRWAADFLAVEALRRAGRPGEAEDYAAELLAVLPSGAIIVRGIVLMALGRFDEALPFLESIPVTARRALFWQQIFDPVRDDPRFHQLLRKIGCAEDYAVARAEREELRKGALLRQ
jgi:TolB-like protein/Tfp pilus assembly protein PilF